ncbi:hypothetical protein PSH25_003439 [Micromonospora sp. PSH25]|nr:hypothetical protein [Micromonospora foliorum]
MNDAPTRTSGPVSGGRSAQRLPEASDLAHAAAAGPRRAGAAGSGRGAAPGAQVMTMIVDE